MVLQTCTRYSCIVGSHPTGLIQLQYGPVRSWKGSAMTDISFHGVFNERIGVVCKYRLNESLPLSHIRRTYLTVLRPVPWLEASNQIRRAWVERDGS